MAPRTRYFLIGSALIVAVGLGTGLVAYYSGALPKRAAGLAEFAYLPADATAVAFADVRDIMDSEFRQRVRQLLPAGHEKDRLHQETGIDIERDIDTVVAGMTGTGPGASGQLVILRGRFDAARIEAVAAGHGGVPEDYRSVRLIRSPATMGGPSGPGVHGMAFLGTGLIALGTLDTLKAAIDAAASRSGVAENADLMRAVAGIQNTGNAWLVGRTSALSDHPGMPAQVTQQLGSVEWIAVGADIDRGVRAIVRAETRDAQAGEDLRAVINGAVAAAKMFAGQDERFEAALQSVRAAGTGRMVELSFEAPSELLDLFSTHSPRQPLPGQ